VVAAKKVSPEGMGNVNKTSVNVPRIEEIEVKFKRNKKHDSEEFKRQLKDQQDGINEITVEEFLTNRDRYLKDGRALEGDAAQKLARKKVILWVADPSAGSVKI